MVGEELALVTIGGIIAFIFWMIIVPTAIATAISLLLAPRQKTAKPPGKEAFELPTAEEGRPLPVLFGCRRIRSPNAISPLLEYHRHSVKKRLSTFGRKQTVAYLYYIGLHLGLCHANIDGVKQIWFAETCVWPILNDVETQAADGQTVAQINAGDCWGGYEKEGGVSGPIHIQYGASDQILNSYLQSKLGGEQPAYRGFVGLILANLYVSTMNMLKPISVLAKRTDKHIDGSKMWYDGKSFIGNGDMNAIHIIYELLTDPIIGLGKDTSLIGDSFQEAANECYTEGYGLSNVWDWAADDIEQMIQEIEQIIDGKVYIDPSSGKFEIGLVRPGYEPDKLEEFGPEDFWIESMPASSTSRITTKIIVFWHDRINLQSRPAFDDDIALLARQAGNPIVQEFDYSAFICSGELATKVAARIQAVFSAMPRRYTLHTLRTMSHLHETQPIKISYPALNIVSMIVRIATIDRGNLMQGECIIEVLEDVFGQVYTIYGPPPASGTIPATPDEKEIYFDEDYSQIFFFTSGTETEPS